MGRLRLTRQEAEDFADSVEQTLEQMSNGSAGP